MTAVAGRLPVNQRGWAWELKQSGVRALAVLDEHGLRWQGRDSAPAPGSHPALARMADDLGGRKLVLDGVISPPRDKPSYRAFDVLRIDGHDLTAEPYAVRRKLLRSLGLSRSPVIEILPSHRGLGPAQLAQLARQHDAAGIVGKHLASPYRPGQASQDWIELDLLRGCEAVIGGWQPSQDHEPDHVGAVLLGVYTQARQLVYIGRVHSGFTDASRRALASVLEELATDSCPFTGRGPTGRDRNARWVRPTLIADVNYRAITADGRLRQPTWRGLRTDIDPRDQAWSGSLRLRLTHLAD